MQIGILQTGKTREALAVRHGEYPPMFEALFARAAPEFRFRTYAVVDGQFPDTPTGCDAWLVTGSKHGVYDDLPWIAPLCSFLREIRASRRPILGICFGHQILAEAFGGKAAKSERGWGLGVHDYTVRARPGWMSGAPGEFAMHAVHQDQVIKRAADATVLASSPFCPLAMLTYGDPEAPDAVSIQPHPEFTGALTGDIIDVLEAEGLAPQERTVPARETIDRPTSGDAFAEWAAAYLRLVSGKAAAA